ncbi:MAG: Bacteriophage Lambda NinG protein [Devosia sp.]|uniref:hypothetical protein n=1 Tax=Devosia sp. TaxID=1871048 RepID=UPI002617A063|nr:hypothetical protein [Devosia sp.]MDB5541230.1 Bacteriophage Lambda NinG protein [Devosia sp.]
MAKPRLAGPRPERRQRIFEGPARDAVIDKAASILRRGVTSKFEFEAECRHGIRCGLIGHGHGWQAADAEAASLVAAALNSIGAVRPPWAVGQPEATIPRENCQRCGKAIDDEDLTAGRRYCSEACAQAAKAFREEHFLHIQELQRHAAWFISATAAAPEKLCAVCNEPFRALRDSQTTCSRKCGSAWRIDPARQKHCAVCQRPFRDKQSGREQRFCSPECGLKGMRAELPQRQCALDECGMQFAPNSVLQKYCCEAHRDRANAREARARKAALAALP